MLTRIISLLGITSLQDESGISSAALVLELPIRTLALWRDLISGDAESLKETNLDVESISSNYLCCFTDLP